VPPQTPDPEVSPPLSRSTASLIVADARDQPRARTVRRLATLELIELAYGPGFGLLPSLAGPDRCPPWCPYCTGLPA
jgi:hypothetical protein